MPALNFPSSPTLGQTFSGANKTWSWDGAKWVVTQYDKTLNADFIDAKGDLLVGSGVDAFDNLTVGANDTILVADSAQTLGVKWTATLSGLTLTAPKFADLGFIADANGNEMVIFDTTASAVNELTVANAAVGGTPAIKATGNDTNISINLVPKGTGSVQANGTPLATTGKAIAMALVFG